MQKLEKEKEKMVLPATLWKDMKALCFHGNKKKIPLFYGASKKQWTQGSLDEQNGSTILSTNPNLSERAIIKKRTVSKKEIIYYLMFLW